MECYPRLAPSCGTSFEEWEEVQKAALHQRMQKTRTLLCLPWSAIHARLVKVKNVSASVSEHKRFRS